MAGCGPCGQRALYLIGEPIYDSSWSYNAGDYVVVAGVLYRSLGNDNQGNNPQEAPEWWERTTILDQLEILSTGSSVLDAIGFEEWDSEKAYDQNEGCQFEGRLFVSSIAGSGTNQGNEPDPEASTEFWGRYPKRVNGILKYILDNMLVPGDES